MTILLLISPLFNDFSNHLNLEFFCSLSLLRGALKRTRMQSPSCDWRDWWVRYNSLFLENWASRRWGSVSVCRWSWVGAVH